jgi:hypothetical protein
MNRIWIFLLTVKYWCQGDSWQAAGDFARFVVTRFK